MRGPWRRLCALPAFWVGLTYDQTALDAAWDLVKDWTTEQRAAWKVGDVAPAGEAGSTGQFTFSILVDGGGQDLADQTSIVNNALFGIDPVEVPANAALTSTITTTSSTRVKPAPLLFRKTFGINRSKFMTVTSGK